MLKQIAFILMYLAYINAFNAKTAFKSQKLWPVMSMMPRNPISRVRSNLQSAIKVGVGVGVGVAPSLAGTGGVQKSTIEEAKAAVLEIKKVLEYINSVESLADNKDADTIVKVLSDPSFQKFDQYCLTLTRSDAITPEDKVALGTIKRYGVVADAIIMIGGLGAEMEAGGYKIAGKVATQDSIEDEAADDDDELKVINWPEVKRYCMLASSSVRDILRIGNPLLNK
jgi:hypothetical protein